MEIPCNPRGSGNLHHSALDMPSFPAQGIFRYYGGIVKNGYKSDRYQISTQRERTRSRNQSVDSLRQQT
mgnify:CR=1 FL=1